MCAAAVPGTGSTPPHRVPTPSAASHARPGPRRSEAQQAALLGGCRGVLGRASFRFEPPWVRIISGADEGVYGWIALNYLEGARRGWRWCTGGAQ